MSLGGENLKVANPYNSESVVEGKALGVGDVIQAGDLASYRDGSWHPTELPPGTQIQHLDGKTVWVRPTKASAEQAMAAG